MKDSNISMHLDIHELLEQINYVLSMQKKQPLICLDKPTEDITNEAIKFSFYTLDNTQQKDDLISELQKLIEDGKNKQNEMIVEYNTFKEKFNSLFKQYKEYLNNFEDIMEKNSKYIDSLEIKMNEIRKNIPNKIRQLTYLLFNNY